MREVLPVHGPRNWILGLIPPNEQCPAVELGGRVHDLLEQALGRVQLSSPVCPHICQGSRLDVAQKPRPQSSGTDCFGAHQEAASELGDQPSIAQYDRPNVLPALATISNIDGCFARQF